MYLQCLALIAYLTPFPAAGFLKSECSERQVYDGCGAAAAEMTAAGRPRPAAADSSEEKPIKSWIASTTPALACPWCCSTSPHDPNGHSALLVMCALQNKALIDRHAVKKSVNLQYNTLGCLDDGTNKSQIKSLMFQVSFFYTFYRLRKLKTLYSYFCNFVKSRKIN